MPRPPTGTVVEKLLATGDTTYAARITYNGARWYLTLGRASRGWSRRRAEDEVRRIADAASAGRWRHPKDRAARLQRLPPRDPRGRAYSSIRKALQDLERAVAEDVDRDTRARLRDAQDALYRAEDSLSAAL